MLCKKFTEICWRKARFLQESVSKMLHFLKESVGEML